MVLFGMAGAANADGELSDPVGRDGDLDSEMSSKRRAQRGAIEGLLV